MFLNALAVLGVFVCATHRSNLIVYDKDLHNACIELLGYEDFIVAFIL